MKRQVVPSPKVTVDSTKVTVYTLNGQDIRDLLARSGVIFPDSAKIEIQFDVPGGGNYGNVTLDIDNENPVVVKVTERSITQQPRLQPWMPRGFSFYF